MSETHKGRIMTVIKKSFRDFFAEAFYKEKTYERISPCHFKSFFEEKMFEMSMPRDIRKESLHIDKEDIQFLQQFPHAVWNSALHKRYEMMYDQLEKRHKETAGESQKLAKLIKDAALSQDWSHLEQLLQSTFSSNVAEKVIYELKDRLTPELVRTYRQNYLQRYEDWKRTPEKGEKEPTDPLDEIIEHKVSNIILYELKPHLDEPEGADAQGRVPFNFGKRASYDDDGNQERQAHVYMAKPYINRLYHKIERTGGHPHIEGSGLEGELGRELGIKTNKDGHPVGQYGYDLRNPQRAPNMWTVLFKNGEEVEVVADSKEEIPTALKGKGKKWEDLMNTVGIKKATKRIISHVTDGMRLPNEKNMEEKITDLFNLNSHQVFGDPHTGEEGVEWRLVPGRKDIWAIEYAKTELAKKYENQLKRGQDLEGCPIPEGGFKDKIVKGETVSKTQQIRQHAANCVKSHFKQEVEQGRMYGAPVPGVPMEKRKIGINGNTFVHPALYLPMKRMKVVKNGQEVEQWIPVVNPSHAFRELGSDHNDYMKDENGKDIYDPDTGEPRLNVPKEKLRGHGKFVHVSEDEYVPGVHKTGASFQPNKYSHERHFLSPADAGYQDAWNQVFGQMRRARIGGVAPNIKVIPDENGEFYYDLLQGIRRCAGGSRCGEATPADRSKIWSMMAELHSMIQYMLSQNLRNKKYWGDDKEAIERRMQFANDITAGFAQKNIAGMGSRRMRLGDEKIHSMDTMVAGKDGGEISKTYDSEVADKSKTTNAFDRDDEEGGGEERGSAAPLGKGAKFIGTRSGAGASVGGSDSVEHSPYNLDNYKSIVQQLISAAKQNDDMIEDAMKEKGAAIGRDVFDLLNKGFEANASIIQDLMGILTSMYESRGLGPKEAQREAIEEVSNWTKAGLKGKALMDKFLEHPMVQEVLGNVSPDWRSELKKTQATAAPKKPMSPEDIELLKSFWPKVEAKLKQLQGPALKAMVDKNADGFSKVISDLIASSSAYDLFDSPAIDEIQSKIDQIYGSKEQPAATQPIVPTAAARPDGSPSVSVMARPGGQTTKIPATTQAARVITSPDAQQQQVPIPTESVTDLGKRKDWLAVAHHPNYLNTHSNALLEHKKKLLDHFHANRDKYQKYEYDSAVANLERSIRGM